MPDNRRDDIRAQIVTRTGIDEVMIERLVHSFYANIQDDPVLGPVFAARITEWDAHLQRMCDFWSSVILMSGRFHGNPMEKHASLPVDARHFDRWLDLFARTAQAVCPPAAADHFVERAQSIAKSLELGIAMGKGKLLGKDQRFIRDDLNIGTERTVPGEGHNEQSER